MKLNSFALALSLALLSFSCGNNNGKEPVSRIDFINRDAENKIDVMIDGKFFTAFCWPESVYKPILYPVLSYSGNEITRGFPLKPREGERDDHIHQVGIWFNYGNVNGLDFWGNGYRGIKEPKGGEIKHKQINRLSSNSGKGMIVSVENWVDPTGKIIMEEETEYHFSAKGKIRIIDRITTLTASDTTLLFKDTKEGMFGIRVARQLELPSKEEVILLDAMGNPSTIKTMSNDGVTGNYRSSEGISGEAVWGKRAKWMELSGIINNEKISLIVCDHPENPGYPTYWHARGYGLFAANPLGVSDFTEGKESFNLTLKAKESVKFRYRVIVSSDTSLSDSDINAWSDDFKKKYK